MSRKQQHVGEDVTFGFSCYKYIFFYINLEEISLIDMENDQIIKSDIIRKFEIFRSIAETNQQKYKEAMVVLERLKEENNLSKGIERNLLSQLTEAQNRLIHLQENQKKYFILKEKNEEIEKTTYLLEGRLSDIQKLIQEYQEKSNKFMNSRASDVELQKKLGKLNAMVKERNADIDFLKKEVKMLQDEKIDIITQYEEKMAKLHDELQSAKKENNEIKLYSEKTLQIYKRQIMDYEKTIKGLEREKNQLLRNRTQSIIKEAVKPNSIDKRVTWADSTVSSFSEDSFNKMEFDQNHSEEVNSELCEELVRVESAINLKKAESQMNTIKEICTRRNFLPKVKNDSSKYPRDSKQMLKSDKPELNFIVSTSENSSMNDSSSKIKKRRLFYDDGEGDFLME